MRSVLSAILTFTFLSTPSVALGGSIGHELSVDLPPEWIVLSDTLAFPVHIVNDGASAQLSVFRSDFRSDNIIRNKAELKASVQKVIDDVILTLPESRLLTSTGFDRTDRAGFILEFVSRDTSAQLDLRHRFEGVLYRLDDGNQVMFTLWAKVPKDQYPASDSAIRTIQASFEYHGPKDAVVFPARVSPYTALALLLLLGLGLLFFAHNRRKKNKVATTDFSDKKFEHARQSPLHR